MSDCDDSAIQRNSPASANWEGAATLAVARAESISLVSRFKSARSSAAVWQRSSRSFSRAVLMISSSLAGRPGFKLRGEVGVRPNMAWKITPAVFPKNGCWPVAISWSTAPKEKRSLRGSNFARASVRATYRRRCRLLSRSGEVVDVARAVASATVSPVITGTTSRARSRAPWHARAE